MERAGNLVEEQGLVVGVLQPEIARGHERAPRRLAQLLIGLEHELQLEGQAGVAFDGMPPRAGDETYLVHRNALHLDVEAALRLRRSRRFRKGLDVAVRRRRAQGERRRAPRLFESHVELVERGRVVGGAIVDDELAAAHRDEPEIGERRLRTGREIEESAQRARRLAQDGGSARLLAGRRRGRAGRRLSRARNHDRLLARRAGGDRERAVRHHQQAHHEIEDLEPPWHGAQFEQREGIERQFRARRFDDGAPSGDRFQMIDRDRRSMLRPRDARRVERELHALETLAERGGDARAQFVDLDRTKLQAHEQRAESHRRDQRATERGSSDDEQPAPQQARLDAAARYGAGVRGQTAQRDRKIGEGQTAPPWIVRASVMDMSAIAAESPQACLRRLHKSACGRPRLAVAL